MNTYTVVIHEDGSGLEEVGHISLDFGIKPNEGAVLIPLLSDSGEIASLEIKEMTDFLKEVAPKGHMDWSALTYYGPLNNECGAWAEIDSVQEECILDAGHTGEHLAEDGAHWYEPCHCTHYESDGIGAVPYQCELPTDHTGEHSTTVHGKRVTWEDDEIPF